MTPTPKQVRDALSGLWSYSQAKMVIENLRNRLGTAWEWLTPRVREALVAERCFAVCRQSHREVEGIRVRDMDHFLAAMRFAAGLADWDEVKDWLGYAEENYRKPAPWVKETAE